jgi:hypothetical protein
MKTIIYLSILLFSFFLINDLKGQTTFNWGKQFGSAKEDDSFGITSDPYGNIYITGYTNGALSGQNYGKSDAFVVKADSASNILWTNQFGTTEDDQINAITSDKKGNIYITGFTKGTIDTKNAGNEDVFIGKLDSSGSFLWKKQFGSDRSDIGNAICLDDSGNVYIAGATMGLFGDSICGSYDAFVLKLDKEGNKVYIRQFGTSKNESCSGIALDTEGKIYVSGSTFGVLGEKSLGGEDAYIALFDEQMKPIRYIQFGTPGSDSYVKIALDKEGYIYAGGSTGGSLGGKQLGNGDSFLAKFNKQGENLWSTQFGLTGWDGIHCIVINEQLSDNIIVSGCQNWPSCQSFIREYRKDGKLVGAQNYAMMEKNKGTCGRTSCLDNNGNIYNTGLTDEKLFSDALGEHDIFILKMGQIKSSSKPYVNSAIESPTAYTETQFTYTFPDTIFKSDEGKINFTYSALAVNGDQLPSWLSFNPETRTFSGTPATTGMVFIKMVATDGTKAVSSCIFTIVVKKNTTSSEIAPVQKIKIYPNPTKENLELIFGSTPCSEALVKISDIQGKFIFYNTFHNVTKTTINLAGNPKGIYFAKIVVDGEMYAQKINLN